MATEEKKTEVTDKKKRTWTGKKNKKEVQKLKEELEALKDELSEAKDKYIRLYAEFDNYKKRTVREKLEMMSTAARETIQSLLPVLDDFDRAKKSADDENSDEVFSEGVSLVYNKLNALLKSKGLEVMVTEDARFDPEYHEAITEIPVAEDSQKGMIVDTVEKGYLLNDKIIRHAKVVVGK